MIECSNCGRFTSPNEDYCEYCHEKITQEAIEKYEERKKNIVEIEQKNTEFLDTKSKNIVDFFSIFNMANCKSKLATQINLYRRA
ncbi:MAG: hypothetical protein ACTINU_06135, partial [Pseudolactococcus laudensis]